MNHRTWVALIAFIPSIAWAQTQAAAGSRAAQCQADADAYSAQKFDSVRKSGARLTSAIVVPIQAQAKAAARECAGKIRMSDAASGELAALTTLYLYTNDTALAKSAMETARTRKGLSEAEQATIDLAALKLSIATFDPFTGINKEAEQIVASLDRMSDAMLAQKIRGHEMLLGRYEYADNDDGLRDHARKLLALGKKAVATNALGMSPPRNGVSYNLSYEPLATAYSSIIRGHGDFLHPDSALMVLDEEERALGDGYPSYDLKAQREMYRLVGTAATPIEGKWWINGTDGESVTPGNGKVTLIQFTAHWCVPCKHSYPGFLRLSNRFAGKPFEPLMETYLYGYIGAKRNLTPEQEVAEDKNYYAGEWHLPFKIAVNEEPKDTTVKDAERRYVVNGIPQIVVVDKRGVIRAMVTGWDKGNEQRLGELIDRLLREK
jgi:thiol-disulfide isomerase/thioredoxin